MRIFLSILVVTMLALVQVAEAKRFGGGRSLGHSHSYSKPSSSRSHNNSASSQSSSRNTFGKLLAAGAIGAALGYLFTGAGGGIGWILLAIIAFFVISRVMRSRKMNQPRGEQRSMHQSDTGDNGDAAAANNTSSFVTNGKMPDGTPEAVFRHQCMNLFQQLQDLNTADALDKVKGYLTPQMFEQIREEVNSNDEVAQFRELQTEIAGFEKNGSKWTGSVRFSGQVKENSRAQWQFFEEIWHFERDRDEHLWQLAGIQQIDNS